MDPFHLWSFIISHMDPVHLSSLSRVTWIFLQLHGCSPPVFFIKNRMDLSLVTWMQSNCLLYQESHGSVFSHMDAFHLSSLSLVTWIQSTCLLYQESHGSVFSHMDAVHLSSLSGVAWICLQSHGSNPPVFFIKSHMDLSWFRWAQSTSGPYHLLALVMNLWVPWTVQWLSAAQGLRPMELYFVVVRPILLSI